MDAAPTLGHPPFMTDGRSLASSAWSLRRVRNQLSRWRRGLEHRRESGWARFEAEIRDRRGPGVEGPGAWVERAVQATLTRRSDPAIEAIEARRRRLLDAEDEVRFLVEGASEASARVQTVGPLCARACKPHPWALLLYHLARGSKARTAVELGTCFGITAAYLAFAVGPRGRVLTLEGCADYTAWARETLDASEGAPVELVFGRFDRTLADACARAAPIDLLFLDGHHEERATAAYLETARPHLADDAVVVFDDIRWSEGMTRAWERLRFGAWADLGPVGVCRGAPG